MPDALQTRETLLIGRNEPPPLAERMLAGSAADRTRAEEIANQIAAAPVANAEDAARVTALANLARDHRGTMDRKRVELKKPYDDDAAAVQNAYQPWIRSLDDAITLARKNLDAYNDAIEEAARAKIREADRIADEARKQAQQRAMAARELTGQGDVGASVAADLASLQAEERAAQAAADAAKPEPVIRTQFGMASRQTRREPVIVDALKLCRWLIKNQPGRLEEALIGFAKACVRGHITPDGVEVREVATMRFSR